MNLYNTHVIPKLTHLVCSQKDIANQRKKLVPKARGRVLEVGIGSGLNLPFYDPTRVDQVWGVEPSDQLKKRAVQEADISPLDINFIGTTGEDIPLDSNSMDTVVVTYTLCTIPDVQTALIEMKRVLKPGGRLLFCEHGRAPDNYIARWQDRINPVWKKIAGGCNLNRQILFLLQETGFSIKYLEQEYASPLKIISFNYRGMALKL